MSIKRFVASKDNTITNAFKAGNRTRGTKGNMGASDIVEVFSIYAQASSSSLEQSRILLEFPVSEISQARESGVILESGSVSFKLKMFNAPHSQTTPSSYTLSVHPLSSSWSEGTGLDMEEYSDLGASNWISSSTGNAWSSAGGDFLNDSYVKTVSFDTGLEDFEVDVTDVMEDWISGELNNYGFLIKLSGSSEDGTEEKSYYTKRFFGRTSEYELKRPVIEVQQSKLITDDRANLYKSSSLLPSSQNLNKIYFYNKHNGVLKDIPGAPSNLFVQFYSTLGSSAETVSGASVSENYVSASKFSTGIYEAEFVYSGDATELYDVWSIKDTSTGLHDQVLTGSSMQVKTHKPIQMTSQGDFNLKILNLKDSYFSREVENFRVYTRQKNKTPNVYTKATGKSQISIIPDLYYKVVRVSDNFEVVGYSTSSSVPYSKLSYDVSGSYFDFDMSILQPNYLYEISFLIKDDNSYIEQKEKFRFRVKS